MSRLLVLGFLLATAKPPLPPAPISGSEIPTCKMQEVRREGKVSASDLKGPCGQAERCWQTVVSLGKWSAHLRDSLSYEGADSQCKAWRKALEKEFRKERKLGAEENLR